MRQGGFLKFSRSRSNKFRTLTVACLPPASSTMGAILCYKQSNDIVSKMKSSPRHLHLCDGLTSHRLEGSKTWAGRQALPAKEDGREEQREIKGKGYLRVIFFSFYSESLRTFNLPASSSRRAEASGLIKSAWFIESIKLMVLEVLNSCSWYIFLDFLSPIHLAYCAFSIWKVADLLVKVAFPY